MCAYVPLYTTSAACQCLLFSPSAFTLSASNNLSSSLGHFVPFTTLSSCPYSVSPTHPLLLVLVVCLYPPLFFFAYCFTPSLSILCFHCLYVSLVASDTHHLCIVYLCFPFSALQLWPITTPYTSSNALSTTVASGLRA
jgi:hypothetical protein